MQRAWLAFARGDDANHPGIPEWPPYSTANRATMAFATEVHVEVDPQASDRLAWSNS